MGEDPRESLRRRLDEAIDKMETEHQAVRDQLQG